MIDIHDIYYSVQQLQMEVGDYRCYIEGERNSYGDTYIEPDELKAEEARKCALKTARAIVRKLVKNGVKE